MAPQPPIRQSPADEPRVHAFPAARLAPFLRAMADPEGTGVLPDAERRAIEHIETTAERSDAE